MSKKQSNYIVHENTCYEKCDTELLTYFKEVEVPAVKPSVVWKGSKLPANIMKQAVAFCRWSSKKFDGEGLLWLFYDDKTNEWSIWAPPQTTNGMTVSLDKDNDEFSKQRPLYKGIHFGTIHDHHHSGAFQSGTDEDDECNVEGIHITLGNTNQTKLSIHTRISLAGSTEQNFTYRDWFELPEWYTNIPQGIPDEKLELLQAAFNTAFLTFNPKKPEDYFPEIWQNNIKKNTVPIQGHSIFGNMLAESITKDTQLPLGISDSSSRITHLTPMEELYLSKIQDFMIENFIEDPADLLYYVEVNEDPAEGLLRRKGLIELGYDAGDAEDIIKVRKWMRKNPSPYPKAYNISDYVSYLVEQFVTENEGS